MRGARGRMTRGTRAAALAAIVALALAGCASIPDSGSVRQGAPIAQQGDTLDLDFNPAPPANGATPDQIVHGFIDAASSPKNSFAVARQYLTSSLASSWNPDDSVTVDRGVGRVYSPVSGSSQWQVDVTPVADVDATGLYHSVASSAPVSLRYALVKAGGQWRIASAPNGVVIDDPTFRAVYGPHTLYFYSPSFTYLVPDVRWFPSRVATAATRVTNAVLAGPSRWLGPAVASAFPAGTELAVSAVTTSGGNAQVDLSSQASQADSLRMQRMKFELEASLGSLAQSVELSIDGSLQAVTELSGQNAPIQDPSVSTHPLVFRNGQFGLLSGANVADIPGLSDKVVALRPSSASLNAAHDVAVVMSQGQVSVVRKGTAAVRVDVRPGLIPPALDNDGYVWSVPSSAPAELVAIGADGAQKPVKTNWPESSQIVSFAVSRDATRAIAVLKTPTGYVLAASGIIRGDSNLPVSLQDPYIATLGPGAALSAAWIDENSVVVLGSTVGDATSIEQVQLGSVQSTTAGPANGAVVVGASGLSQYLVLAADDTLQAPTGTGWQAQAEKVGALGTQLGPGQ